MSQEKIIWDAEFNPSVKSYWLLSGCLVLLLTIFGIFLIPIWYVVGLAITGKYLASHRCTLTSRNLKVSKGVFVKQENTVPLDRITDLALIQGPIMRAMDIEALKVETAGQSGQGALIQLAGIKNGRAFRDAVLKQRDAVVGSNEDRAPAIADATSSAPTTELLTEIRDILVRLENRVSTTDSDVGV